MTDNILSYMTFFPLAGMIVVLLLPSKSHNLIRWASALFTVPPLLLGVWLYGNFDRINPGLQFVEKIPWIPAYNIDYFVGVDGISISMVLLTALLSFLCIFASWGIDKGVKGYFALFLLLDTGMMGVFVALDFFLFYIFWELMLLPMYFLIGIWGGPRREYAAIKFFLYTLFGSVLMLLAILALYFTSEPHTFDMTRLIAQSGKYGVQPLAIDRCIASHADAICARGEALECRIDVADLLDVPRHFRVADVGQQIGERFVFQIVDLAGDVGVALHIRTQQGTANFLTQCEPPLAKAPVEMGVIRPA